jgi:hypothetical protein
MGVLTGFRDAGAPVEPGVPSGGSARAGGPKAKHARPGRARLGAADRVAAPALPRTGVRGAYLRSSAGRAARLGLRHQERSQSGALDRAQPRRAARSETLHSARRRGHTSTRRPVTGWPSAAGELGPAAMQSRESDATGSERPWRGRTAPETWAAGGSLSPGPDPVLATSRAPAWVGNRGRPLCPSLAAAECRCRWRFRTWRPASGCLPLRGNVELAP